MMRVAVEPMFDSLAVLLVIVVVLLAVPLLVHIHGDELDRRRRRLLVGLRLAAAVLLLLAVVRPTLLATDTEPAQATLAVLLDQSRSMTLSAEQGTSRWAVQLDLWRSLAPALDEMDESLDVRVLGYEAHATELSQAALRALSADDMPEGTATDLAAALEGGLRAAAGQPLAGVILIGDGVHHPRRDHQGDAATRAADPQSAARTLASLDVPLWTIPVGPPGDLDQVRDVSVEELPESFGVFAGNEFTVDFVIRSRALQGVELPVRVWLVDETDQQSRQEVAIRRVTPAATPDATAMSIPVVVDEPGSYRLEVAVAPQDGETLTTNNAQFAFLDVRPGGGRILYLEGKPRPEQTFLRRSLRRFPDLELNYRWLAESGAASWPIDLGSVLDVGSHDIYIIGDLPAAAFGDEQLERLAEAVDAGSGLILLGGLSALDAGGYDGSPLAPVIPVQLGNASDQVDGPIVPRLTGPHPITTLDPSDQSLRAQQAAWEGLPPLLGANRLGPPRVAPGVRVLLETADEDPLLVIGEYGGGRVAAFAGDTTWRWWRQGEDHAHRRFWRQLMLWLIDRDDDDAAQLLVELDQRRVRPGDTVGWHVSWSGGQQRLPEVQVGSADGQWRSLDPDVADVEASRLTGTLPELEPGFYRLQASIAAAEVSHEQTFQVIDDDRELAHAYADSTYMAQLSAQTAASGGRSYLPGQIDELIQRIRELRRTSSAPVVRKYRLGDGPASAWPLLAGIVGLLTAEWLLRRRWGLV